MGIAPDPLGFKVTFNGECLGHTKGIVPDNVVALAKEIRPKTFGNYYIQGTPLSSKTFDEYITSLQNEIMYSYNIPLHLFAQGNLQMTNTVQCLAKSYGSSEPKKLPCKEPSIPRSLLGATVIPTDGSWALTLRNGVMSHESIAYTLERKKWVVIAENGRFPTDYGTHPRHIHNIEDPKNTNDIMMHLIDDPTVISFIRSNYIEVVLRPEPTEEEMVKAILGDTVQGLNVKIETDRMLSIRLPPANTQKTLDIFKRIIWLCNTYKTETRHLKQGHIHLIATNYNWKQIYKDITF